MEFKVVAEFMISIITDSACKLFVATFLCCIVFFVKELENVEIPSNIIVDGLLLFLFDLSTSSLGTASNC
jgi:hypothetical protein